jgi:DNA modification methylase
VTSSIASDTPLIAPTFHTLAVGDARGLSSLDGESVDLVVTSPPYPMIAMWDTAFRSAHPAVGPALDGEDGPAAFALMHTELDKAWAELLRVVKPGGFICINIGDATRTVGGVFRLYPNHTRIETFFFSRGADILPRIIWRKTTNAPNKFMGSGMLPAGAYVTLEHEYILIIRKQGKSDFSAPPERVRRQRSALFWEERNAWFSDLWNLGGARQSLGASAGGARTRSAAFPNEIAWRLIGMYSLQGDTVLDPFVGTGTTACAALALARHSIGFDTDAGLIAAAARNLQAFLPIAARLGRERVGRHLEFVAEHKQAGKTLAHTNRPYGFPVKTTQERELVVPAAKAVTADAEMRLRAEYEAVDGSITENTAGELF